jgi:hypothetical protein
MADDPNPRLSKPLGLPDGSVRAILALLITVGAFWLFYNGKLQSSAFITMVALPLGLYFGQYIAPPGGGNLDKVVGPLEGLATHAVTQLGQAANVATAGAAGAIGNVLPGPSPLAESPVNGGGHINLDAVAGAVGDPANAAEAVAYGTA